MNNEAGWPPTPMPPQIQRPLDYPETQQLSWIYPQPFRSEAPDHFLGSVYRNLNPAYTPSLLPRFISRL
jgi:hypothetical protein